MTEDEVTVLLKSLAERQREQLVAQLVDRELRRSTAYTEGSSKSLDGLRQYLEKVQEGTANKLATLEDVAEAVTADLAEHWDERWFDLMPGKRALWDLVGESPFKSKRLLVDALVQTVREEHPPLAGLEALQGALMARAAAAVAKAD